VGTEQSAASLFWPAGASQYFNKFNDLNGTHQLQLMTDRQNRYGEWFSQVALSVAKLSLHLINRPN
jgi:hypothetical protein